jgi:hypothetical protein
MCNVSYYDEHGIHYVQQATSQRLAAPKYTKHYPSPPPLPFHTSHPTSQAASGGISIPPTPGAYVPAGAGTGAAGSSPPASSRALAPADLLLHPICTNPQHAQQLVRRQSSTRSSLRLKEVAGFAPSAHLESAGREGV